MDQLPAFGRSIFPALMPTMKAYSVLHEKNRSNIESTPREEFKYGSDPRQKLDFYTPKQVSDDTPILVFVYGGGLSRGDKRMPSPPTAEGLVYANIGHYFSSRGFITVIPDYRRTGDGGVFPSGGQDVAGALEWVKNRFSTGNHKLWIMGNSAGAVHSATWLLEPSLAESRKSVQSGSVVIQGVVLVSIPAHFQQAGEDRSEVLTAYYKDKVEQDCALGLVSRAETPITRVLAVLGTLDPEDEIIEPSNDFVKKWKERFGQDKLTEVLLEGHNHFSTVIALGTGIEREESLGTEVLKWMGQA
ncbi:alpha/beta-hydrolase [Aureobasidium pullulans EXF-150]|uniref:Alpha/beta-hydrolase n=1 Tax=Aureobasidium pullulans EXF-150 TaxID=1043002 RepID=A0A074XEP7_AURPU|nr:alpha/beta-hydrolase [Aureobasidium pullulans EXF-150]KEQ83990.1 alpha/beta-hydrolase [Aureobasidium pullulans EXF-150]